MPGAVIPGSICQLADLTYLSIEQPLAFSGPQPPPLPPARPPLPPRVHPRRGPHSLPSTPPTTPPAHSPPAPHQARLPRVPWAHQGLRRAGRHRQGLLQQCRRWMQREGALSPVPLGREQTTQPRLVDTVLGPWSFVSAREKPWAFARERLHALGAALGAPGVYPGAGAGTATGTGTGTGAGAENGEVRNGVTPQTGAEGGKLRNRGGDGGGGRSAGVG